MSKLIRIGPKKVAIIDDCDYALVSSLDWRFVPRKEITSPDGGYALHRFKDEHGVNRTIYMHRLILGILPGFDVDHRDGHTLNNTRKNLRPATRTQNLQNKAKSRVVCTSKYKGVNAVPMKGRRTKGRERWRSNIQVNGKRLHLGYYSTELEAARAYNAAAILHFGEFARLNEV